MVFSRAEVLEYLENRLTASAEALAMYQSVEKKAADGGLPEEVARARGITQHHEGRIAELQGLIAHFTAV